MTEYCDLVMKGGVTSGVIYPKLIARLASKYEFKNIGGTSAGAIAASACAAAQYGARNGNPQAFNDLAKLPDLLSEKASPEGRSKLFTLFQPDEALRQHFSVLMRALNTQSWDAVLAVLWGLICMYRGLVGVSFLCGSLLLWPFIHALAPDIAPWPLFPMALGMTLLVWGVATIGVPSIVRGKLWYALPWTVALLMLSGLMLEALTGQGLTWKLMGSAIGTVVVALLFQILIFTLIVIFFARGLLSGLHGNNYGICSGRTPDGPTDTSQEGVTNWLASYLNALAGLPKEGGPLTFAHLWGHNDPEQERKINLEMMTTAISQQMAYAIPFRPGTRPFYYDPDEWTQLFPKPVMDYLNQVQQGSDGPDASTEFNGLQVISPSGKALRQLARNGDLPVVVAVRMSLSFPILLSAVPLYAIDWSLKNSNTSKKEKQPIVAKRVWFSDGGLSSNMPLHMFDALLPEHPTFAVNLKPEHPDYEIVHPERPENSAGRVYLPTNKQGGRQRYWATPDDNTPLGGLIVDSG